MAVEIFGQTEAISCHRFWPDKWPETYRLTAPEQNYVGVPNPLLASTVMNPLGGMLHDQPGVPGEAVYRSPAITAGYYRDEPATEEAFRYGWFHSGDSCVYDDQGLRIMVDRYKDIVKTGGGNVGACCSPAPSRKPSRQGAEVQAPRDVRRRLPVTPMPWATADHLPGNRGLK